MTNDCLDAACLDASAAHERHPLVSKAAVTTLHNRVLGFSVLQSPLSTAIELEWDSSSTILQVMWPSLPVPM